MTSGKESSEIEEPEIDRFFQFVNPVPGKKYFRNVGFPALDPGDGMGIEGRIGHSITDFLKDLETFHGS